MRFALLFSRARVSLIFALLLPMAQASAQSSVSVKDARVARGEAVLDELTLGKRQPVFDAMRRDFPFLAEATAGYALGDVWGRKVLDTRTRQLAAMAAFASLGQLRFFKIHAGYALDAGVKVEEHKPLIIRRLCRVLVRCGSSIKPCKTAIGTADATRRGRAWLSCG